MGSEVATSQPNSRYVIAQKKREKFLKVLAQTGKVNAAARAVGYTHSGYLNECRKNDEEFAKEWALALESAADLLEESAFTRAHEGVEKPVFYKGHICGFEKHYSDQLTMFLLRGLRPERYAPRGGDTNLNVKFGIAVLPMTAPSAAGWEQQAIEIHANQRSIELDDKPVDENRFEARVKRSD